MRELQHLLRFELLSDHAGALHLARDVWVSGLGGLGLRVIGFGVLVLSLYGFRVLGFGFRDGFLEEWEVYMSQSLYSLRGALWGM